MASFELVATRRTQTKNYPTCRHFIYFLENIANDTNNMPIHFLGINLSVY